MHGKSAKTILVIDNDDGMVQVITTRLKSQGYNCVTAQNGEEGLANYSLGGIDLVITDLNMGSLDGIGFIERVRLFSMVPMIVVTGYAKNYRKKFA